MTAPLNLGFILSQDPNSAIRFTCRNPACRNRLPVDKPIGEMIEALGKTRTLKSIKARCKWCDRNDMVEVSVWRDTWSGPR
jgi:hypothetical protein